MIEEHQPQIVPFPTSVKVVVDTGFLSGVLSVYSIWIWKIPFGLYSLNCVLAVYVVKQILFCYFENFQLVNIAPSFTEMIHHHNGGCALCLAIFVLKMILCQICSSLSLCSHIFGINLVLSVQKMAKKINTLDISDRN